MSQETNPDLLAALGRIDAKITELRDLVVAQRTVKEAYSTAEVAKLLSKSEFTVREWCRHKRIKATKRTCGRGRSQEWTILHEELIRIRNEGLLPLDGEDGPDGPR